MECRTLLHHVFCFLLLHFKTARKEHYSPTFLSSVEDNTGLDTNMAWITYCVRCILTCPWEKQILMLLNLLTWFKAAERKQRLQHVCWTCVQKKCYENTEAQMFFLIFFNFNLIFNIFFKIYLYIIKCIVCYIHIVLKNMFLLINIILKYTFIFKERSSLMSELNAVPYILNTWIRDN